MTDTSHRVYAVVLALAVFFVSWAAIAARPWATAKPDPRLAAIAQREQRLRTDAKLVQQIVDRRLATYRTALKQRQGDIALRQRQAELARAAQASSSALAVSQSSVAPAVRVVNLPPLTVTRTS
jgi:hypothetical protein